MPAERTGMDKDVVVGIVQSPSDSDTAGLASSSSASSSSSSFNVIGTLHSSSSSASLSSSSSLSSSQLNSLEDATVVAAAATTPTTTIAASLINAAATPVATPAVANANTGPSNTTSDFTQQQAFQEAAATAGGVIVVDSKQQRLPLSGTFIALPDTSCNDGGLTVVSGTKSAAAFDCITLPSVVAAANTVATSAASSAAMQTMTADAGNIVISSSNNNSSSRPMSKAAVTPTATYVVAVGPSDVPVGMPHTNKTLFSTAAPSTAATTNKRSLISTPTMSPVLAKFIITTPSGGTSVATKNSSSSSSLDHHIQQQAIPVQVQGQMMTLTSLVPGLTAITGQEHGSQTPPPPKTITITPQQTIMPSLATGGPTQTVVTAMMPSGAGTPTKSTALQINKVPLSPVKTPTKITMIPVSMSKSPSTSAASSIVTMVTRTVAGSDRPVFTMTNSTVKSPSKLIIKQQPKPSCTQHLQLSVGNKPVQVLSYSQAPATLRPVAVSTPSIHHTVPENLHYVRLVTPNTQQAKTTTVSKSSTVVSPMVQGHSIVPASGSTTAQSQATPSQVTITLPLQTAIPGVPKAASSHTSNTPSVQRIILPANQLSLRSTNTSSTSIVPNSGPVTTLTQIRPNLSAAGGGGTSSPRPPTLAQILPGTALIPSGNAGQGYAITTLITQNSKSPAVVNAQLKQDFIPIASNNPVVTANTLARNTINGTNIEATGARPRKPCNCTKSQCLKLYCDCFANGEFCHNCNCTNCANNLEHEEERSRAIKACLDRNPLAFHPKIGKGKGKDGDGDRRHNKGCNCKRSGCLKNYCECYEAKIMCSSICKCVGCKNFEESMERKTLMHLADAAEVRVQQQTAAKSKLSSQISSLPSRPPMFAATGEKLPYTFVTNDVVEETCVCLMARAEESEKLKMPSVQERMVIEEFGRCLMRIIESAHKTKVLADVSL